MSRTVVGKMKRNKNCVVAIIFLLTSHAKFAACTSCTTCLSTWGKTRSEEDLLKSKMSWEQFKKLLLKELGCVDWIDSTEKAEGKGWLLASRACVGNSYDTNIPPEELNTTVFTNIAFHKVRKVNDNDKTITIDLSFTLQWVDNRIRANFSDGKNQEIEISQGWFSYLWQPVIYIHNLTDHADFEGSYQFGSLKLRPKNNAKGKQETLVEWNMESAKATVYCDFSFSDYPLDRQNCTFRFGDASSNVKFRLFNKSEKYTDKAANFDMMTTFVDDMGLRDKNAVGLDIEMLRRMQPFVMKYYLPCIAIVGVSQIGFIIPLSAISGRVALMVTQFLTLTSLFIHQMSASPSGDRLNALGIYLLTSLFFVVAGMIEFAIVLLLKQHYETKSACMKKEMDQTNKKIFDRIWHIEQDAKKDNRNLDEEQGNIVPIIIQPDKKDTKISPNGIDTAALFTFPTLYIAFNSVYWYYYLTRRAEGTTF